MKEVMYTQAVVSEGVTYTQAVVSEGGELYIGNCEYVV